MPITATLITGNSAMGGKAPSIETDRTGTRGERWYWINADEVGAASSAAGLPVDNESWSEALGNLRVTNVRIEYRGGRSSYGPPRRPLNPLFRRVRRTARPWRP